MPIFQKISHHFIDVACLFKTWSRKLDEQLKEAVGIDLETFTISLNAFHCKAHVQACEVMSSPTLLNECLLTCNALGR